MTNDLTTISGSLQEVIDRFEDNLHAMGVYDAQFDASTGILGLISRIPDIEPSTTVHLHISLDLTSSISEAFMDEVIPLSAKLSASYDDISESNVDLQTGEVTGATIIFKKGNTVLGTSITDVNGIATLNYTPSSEEYGTTLGFTAEFSGTDNFDSAVSSQLSMPTHNTYAPASITLSCDKPIIQKDETATLTATVLDTNGNPCENQLVEFIIVDGESLGTATTNSSGEATVYYLGKGTGDLNIRAFCGSVYSDTYTVVDDYQYDPTTSDKTSNYGSSIALRNSGTASITYDSNGYYILTPTTTNSESFIPIPIIEGVNDFVIEFDGYFPQEASYIGLVIYKESSNWIRVGGTKNNHNTGVTVSGSFSESTDSSTTSPLSTWLHFKYEITNNTLVKTVYNGTTQLYTVTKSIDSTWFTSNTKYGFDSLWSTNWNCRIKNIEVKTL